MQNPTTVFITGSGRSGTNITKAIFEKHTKCTTLPFEYRFTIDPGGLIDFINQYSSTWSPFMADKRLRNLEEFLISLAQRNENQFPVSNWLKKVDKKAKSITPYAYAGWELEKHIPGYSNQIRALMNKLTDFKYQASWPGSDSLFVANKMYFGTPKDKIQLINIFSEFLHECIQSILTNTGGEVFVEDNTWSFLFAKDLLDLVPNSKILHIVRDPRDVIASLINQRWTPSELDHILIWYKSVMVTWENQKSILEETQFKEVRLEDLIESPEEIISDACTFLNLPYEETMTKIDLSKSNSGRHKTEFNSNQIDLINESLKDVIERYRYD